MLVAYVRDLEAGTLKINQAPEIVSDTGTMSVWDARAGYGQVVARQAVEWAIHMPIAERAGIARAAIDAIAHGRRPDGMDDDEAMVHDFCVELTRDLWRSRSS